MRYLVWTAGTIYGGVLGIRYAHEIAKSEKALRFFFSDSGGQDLGGIESGPNGKT